MSNRFTLIGVNYRSSTTFRKDRSLDFPFFECFRLYILFKWFMLWKRTIWDHRFFPYMIFCVLFIYQLQVLLRDRLTSTINDFLQNTFRHHESKSVSLDASCCYFRLGHSIVLLLHFFFSH